MNTHWPIRRQRRPYFRPAHETQAVLERARYRREAREARAKRTK